MKHSNLKKVIIMLAVIFLVAIGANAFAGWGRGFYGGGGQGWHHKGWGGYDRPGYGRSDVSEEDWKKMDQEREAFFKDTEALRQQIYEKEMALRSELAKAAPDAGKAAEIQKALSEHQGQFDQKHLDHMIKMREVNPNAGKGHMAGRGRMMDRGRGHMMDRGRGHMMGRGQGYMMDRGQGYMMGRGRGYMMGQGRGYMMGGSGPRGGGYGGGPCWQ